MSQFGNFREKALEGFKSRDLPETVEALVEMWELDFQTVLALCESPIEASLASALFCQTLDYSALWRTGTSNKYFGQSNKLEICPQFPYENFRVDFAIFQAHAHGTITKIIIECDGHEFHERTKKQARRDRSRDRFFTASGWQVLRFTGSEIHEDANACAEQIVELIEHDRADDFNIGRRRP